MKPSVYWDKNTGETLAVILYNEKTYMGTAHCHPEDEDMMSEKTGAQIAVIRAEIKVACVQRNEIQIELKALNHLYHNMLQSKHFNPKSYEAHMLKRQIKMRETELEQMRAMISELRDELRSYIQNKERFYQKVRTIRSQDKKD